MIKFQENLYYDDRLFVLYLCKGTIVTNDNGVVETTIYHEDPPANFIWCVVKYKNCQSYPIFRVDSFEKKDKAVEHIRKIEPTTPLISLKGKSPSQPLSYEEYRKWKQESCLKEYNYKELYSAGGSNPREIILQENKDSGD